MPDVTITHTGVRGMPLFAGTVDFVQPLRSSMLAIVLPTYTQIEYFNNHREQGEMAEENVAALAYGSPPAGGEGLSADAFRGLVTAFKDAQIQRAEDVETGAAVQRREQTKALIDQHIDDTKWRESLHHARQVAERGEKEYLLLRFPSELCTDNARAINNPPNPDWPKTLQGEAMELYARWRDQLSPRGFHLAARVLDFPGGKPGDVGLFLFWGE